MLLEEIISKSNMQTAYRQVTGNNGAAGVDGVGATGFPGQLKAEWETVKAALETGTYQPQAVKRVIIPKPNGGERKLGIPTYMDRLIQQAIGDQLAKMLLAGEVHDGDAVPVNVSPDGDSLVLG